MGLQYGFWFCLCQFVIVGKGFVEGEFGLIVGFFSCWFFGFVVVVEVVFIVVEDCYIVAFVGMQRDQVVYDDDVVLVVQWLQFGLGVVLIFGVSYLGGVEAGKEQQLLGVIGLFGGVKGGYFQ